MKFDLKLVSEWCLLVYVLVGFGLAIIDAHQGVYMIIMLAGFAFGALFWQEHEDSIWKQKYIKLLEKPKEAKKNNE